MGAWGTGIYDNDAAADFATTISERGMGAIQQAFGLAKQLPYLDVDEGNNALVAADVVARLRSGGGEQTSYAEPVTLWVAAATFPDTEALATDARAAIGRVIDRERSEVFQLWAETDSLVEWLGVINELTDRLA